MVVCPSDILFRNDGSLSIRYTFYIDGIVSISYTFCNDGSVSVRHTFVLMVVCQSDTLFKMNSSFIITVKILRTINCYVLHE